MKLIIFFGELFGFCHLGVIRIAPGQTDPQTSAVRIKVAFILVTAEPDGVRLASSLSGTVNERHSIYKVKQLLKNKYAGGRGLNRLGANCILLAAASSGATEESANERGGIQRRTAGKDAVTEEAEAG